MVGCAWFVDIGYRWIFYVSCLNGPRPVWVFLGSFAANFRASRLDAKALLSCGGLLP
jgi:hypothetical protein